MKQYITALGLSCVLGVSMMVQGCFPANQDPLAAASAAAKILDALENAETDAEAITAVVNSLSTLTNAELASAVNLLAGADWSLDDAGTIQELVGQLDEATITQLSEIEFQEGLQTDEQIQQALSDAGVTVTEEQVDLVRDLFNIFEASI